MVDRKPLPAIPTPALLHIAAKHHRGRLIRHFLSEIEEPSIYGQREAWANVIEGVLDELGQCISQGKWLDGVRKWKELRREKKRRERELEREINRLETANAKRKDIQEDDESVKRPESAQDSISSSIHSSNELPALPTPLSKGGTRHIFLCVAPPGNPIPLPTEDSGFDLVPTHIGCSFLPGTFTLHDSETPTILFGRKDGNTSETAGGTFMFKGINSLDQHQHVFRVLRLAVYVHLSLTLEQHLLADSNVQLTFQRPKLPSSPSAPSPITPIDQKQKKHQSSTSLFYSGLRSLFSSSKSTGLGHRSSTIVPVFGRDIQPQSQPRSSLESGGGKGSGFGFSMLGSAAKQHCEETKAVPEHNKTSFAQMMEEIQVANALLSTSPGVKFEPPPLIVELAEKEGKHGQRLTGDEKVGLRSLLGWEGREHGASGMVGLIGFVRHQGIEVLVSRHISSSTRCDAAENTFCGKPRWRTYRYFAEDSEDLPLGATVEELVEARYKPCEVAGCKAEQGAHNTVLVHNGTRVTIEIISREDKSGEDHAGNDEIDMWEKCSNCGASSERRRMSDGTYLLSFGKFLELLIYSTEFGVPNPPLCEHNDRFLLQRHFGTHCRDVVFSLSKVEDIFELRVPRLQITVGEKIGRGSASALGHTESASETATSESEEAEEVREKKELRKEIRNWWEGVSDHMDKLEAIFDDETSLTSTSKSKALPRLPEMDEQYEFAESHPNHEHSEVSTDNVSISGLPSVIDAPSSAPSLQPNFSSVLDGSPEVNTYKSTTSFDSSVPELKPQQEADIPPVDRLSSLRQTFHRTEQSLYAQLARTKGAALNEVRRSFFFASKGAEKRLCAWQKKHLLRFTKAAKEAHNIKSESLEWRGSTEPKWWGQGYHALPGSNVIVKEDDWGSIIAYTLSTPDYQRELTHLASARQASTATQPLSTPPPVTDASPDPSMSTPHSHSSFFSAAMNYKLFISSSAPQPDPDQDDVTWSLPELFSAVVSRKEHPRDPSSLLSIREVLRQQQKSPVPDQTKYGSLGRGVVPPSAWAKPDVQVSRDEADGVVSSGSAGSSDAGRMLQEFEAASTITEPSRLPPSVDLEIGQQKTPSIISSSSDQTVGQETLKELRSDEGGVLKAETSSPPPLPPKDEKHASQRSQERPRDVSNATTTTSSFASTLTNGLNSAMRLMLHNTSSSNVGDTMRPASPSSKAHHGLLLIDERPHIKYDWTIGKRLKFSCTVYYAKQFDHLRKKCGVDDVFIKSLKQSTNWRADGGKSKSNFWKTNDERFIIKTLVDAWNVADLQVLIDLAPSYFRYIDGTANKATVLAKMMGFFTVEIRNLETGNIQSKADLLVMENLFYGRKVMKTFDLKGIQGRKVKASVEGTQQSKTLFDGEWIEGQQKTLMLVRPHSKQVLRSAIGSDADFLAKSNIMDYSLLVGVDEKNKQIACGLVDTIGSFTFAKTLEYKAKHGLKTGKEPTVIPPVGYQERFVNALEGYFLACPDKWSKPLDESKIISDVNLLPSVL